MYFLETLKTTLNKEQLDAVLDINWPQLILAGAWTGKTKTIVNKVAYLISKWVKPQSILLLTFTRKAANEMIDRVSEILWEKYKVNWGTFHSFANSILRKYAKLIGFWSDFTILDPWDSESYISIIRNRAIDHFKIQAKYYPKWNTILNIISEKINTGQSITDILYKEYPQYLGSEAKNNIEDFLLFIEKSYSSEKKSANAMDYDDLLIYLKELLENEKVRDILTEKYKYILIDEFQDTNKMQSYIACLLASNHWNLTVVWDDCQTIYSWRWANHKNIINFPNIFWKDRTKIHFLQRNYRSNDKILDLSNGVINILTEKYEKQLFTDIKTNKKPSYVSLQDSNQEAEFICQEILKLREDWLSLNDISVLFRSWFHSFELELKLKSYNIPFVKYGWSKFLELAHIKDLLAILKIISNPRDFISMYRVLNLIEWIWDKISLNIIEEIKIGNTWFETNYKNKTFYMDILDFQLLLLLNKNISCEEWVKRWIEFYDKFFKIKYEDYKYRNSDLVELLTIAKRYKNINDFLNDISTDDLTFDKKSTKRDDNISSDECLTLSTIHSSKWLERNTVFLIHLVDGFFPSMKTIDEEEEKRLLYVAFTRAKNNLFLTSYISSEGVFLSRSRFLDKIPNFSELVNCKVFKPKSIDSMNIVPTNTEKQSWYLDSIKSFFWF